MLWRQVVDAIAEWWAAEAIGQGGGTWWTLWRQMLEGGGKWWVMDVSGGHQR